MHTKFQYQQLYCQSFTIQKLQSNVADLFDDFPSVLLQELTQEKHELRIRLENVEAEYETTVKDLQHEITSLRHELEEQQVTTRQGDRTRSQIVHELNQQNERLAEQLRKVGTLQYISYLFCAFRF